MVVEINHYIESGNVIKKVPFNVLKQKESTEAPFRHVL